MDSKRHNSVTGVIMSALVTLLLVWGVTSLTNEDPLWFLNRFDAQAEALVIYWDGEVTTLEPGDGAYAPVMAAFATAMAKPAGYEGSVAFSEANITHYREGSRLLEVQFAEPLQVHTRHPYATAATYLVPLDGTHAYTRRVFSFPGFVPYTSGPLNVEPSSFEMLLQAVEGAVSVASVK
jgi:hypothetical protein